eukprot:gene23276-biopygen5815
MPRGGRPPPLHHPKETPVPVDCVPVCGVQMDGCRHTTAGRTSVGQSGRDSQQHETRFFPPRPHVVVKGPAGACDSYPWPEDVGGVRRGVTDIRRYRPIQHSSDSSVVWSSIVRFQVCITLRNAHEVSTGAASAVVVPIRSSTIPTWEGKRCGTSGRGSLEHHVSWGTFISGRITSAGGSGTPLTTLASRVHPHQGEPAADTSRTRPN